MAFLSKSRMLPTRGFATSSMALSPIKEFVVIGGGLMGAGIAQVGAQTGHKVTLIDVSQDVLDKSQKRIGDSIKRVAKKMFKEDPNQGENFIEQSMGNLSIATSANKSLETADLVVEAVSENMELKHKLFKEYDQIAPAKTIFASNTSTLSITKIASVTQRKDRFGGLHFFNPVPVMKLLEVIRTEDTSEETIQAMTAWGKAMKKTTVSCKDTPGFIVNRLLVPLLSEAVQMVERGDATFQDIDIGMKLGAGHPMGPIELMDYTGLDLHADITKSNAVPGLKKSPIIEKLVAEGKFGVKTGEGFYKYSKK